MTLQEQLEIAACPECRQRMRDAEILSEQHCNTPAIVWSRCRTCTERLRGAPTP